MDRERGKYSKFNAELWTQVQLASPVVLANVLWYGVLVVNMVFVGHIEATPQLVSAVALSNMFTNVTGFSLGFGLSSGIDTLGGQAYGAKNYKMVSRVLQRTLCIISMFCMPALVLWWFSEDVLLLLGQDPVISALAGRYARLCMPGLWPSLAYQAVVTYLQCQGIMGAEVVVGLLMNAFNLFITWFYVVHLELGFEGGALANSTSNWAGFSILIATIWYNEYHVLTWESWSRKCLTKWWQVLSISVPGMFMSCAEWWIFEIFVIIAGFMGPLALASYGIVQQLSVLLFMIPLGISVASTTRVSNLLGANQPSQAQFSAWVSLVYAQILIAFNLALLFVFHGSVGRMFSRDPMVIQAVSDLLTILALTLFFDGTQTVMCGILKGMGRQKIGSLVNFIGYYLIALPSAVFYVYQLQWGVAGLWWGLLSGLAFVTVVFFFVMLKVDWTEEATQALRRMMEEASPCHGPIAIDDGHSDETTNLLAHKQHLNGNANGTGVTAQPPRSSPHTEPGVGRYLWDHAVPLHRPTSSGDVPVPPPHSGYLQRAISEGTPLPPAATTANGSALTTSAHGTTTYAYSINAARADGGAATETVVLHSHTHALLTAPVPPGGSSTGHGSTTHTPQRSRSTSDAVPPSAMPHTGTLLNALQMINAVSGYGAFHSHTPTAHGTSLVPPTGKPAMTGAASSTDVRAGDAAGDDELDAAAEHFQNSDAVDDPLRK